MDELRAAHREEVAKLQADMAKAVSFSFSFFLLFFSLFFSRSALPKSHSADKGKDSRS
jgi:hypothetical protein